VRTADKIPPYVPIVSKSGSLNLLEPSGPVRSLYRDCFTFTFTLRYDVTFEPLRAHFRGKQRILMHPTLAEFLLKRDSTRLLKGIQGPTDESVNWKYFVILENLL
jgi:hypothetical protein